MLKLLLTAHETYEKYHTDHPGCGCGSLIGSALTQQRAFALQGGEDPSLLPVLIDKRFSGRSRHQVGVLFSSSMADKFIESIGGAATYGYNFQTFWAWKSMRVSSTAPRPTSWLRFAC